MRFNLVRYLVASCVLIALLTVHPQPVAATSHALGSAQTRSPRDPQAFVANYEGNSGGSVSIIDTITNQVVGTLITGRSPIDVAVNPVQQRAYVVNYQSSDVSVIDTSTDTILKTIRTGQFPTAIAIDPTGTKAYVGQEDGGVSHIYVLNLMSNVVKAIVTLPPTDLPTGIAFNPTRHVAYVGDGNNDTLLILDTFDNKIVKTIVLGNRQADVASVIAGPRGLQVFVGDLYTQAVQVVDAASLQIMASIPLPGAPEGMGWDPVSGDVWVPTNNGNIAVISRQFRGLKHVYKTGPGPFDVAFTPDGAFAYVADGYASNVDVIDTHTGYLVASIPVGSVPIAIAIQ